MFDQNSYFRNLYDSGVRNKLVSMSDSRELQYAIDKLQFGEYILKSYPNITSLAKYTKKINTLETEKGFLERDIDDLLEEKSRIVQEKKSGEWEKMDKQKMGTFITARFEIEKIMQEYKWICKTENCASILVSQLNREIE